MQKLKNIKADNDKFFDKLKHFNTYFASLIFISLNLEIIGKYWANKNIWNS